MSKHVLVLALLAGCPSEDNGDYNSCFGAACEQAVALDDQIVIGEDMELAITELATNDEHVRVIEVTTMPAHGTIVETSGGGALKYVPDPGYFGPDQFTYIGSPALDINPSNEATVSITIESDDIAYEQSRLLAETTADDLAIADFDGDGKTDLVVCDHRFNEMTVLLNTTSIPGNYTVDPHRFEAGVEPTRIAAADLDGDGRPEIITATAQGLAVYRNITAPQGPLAFAGPTQLGTLETMAVVSADLDGDGDIDLAATQRRVNSFSEDRLAIFLNDSTSGFGPATIFTAPPSPQRLVALDADGDGRTDLAVLGNDRLSLFVNATAVGETVPAFQARIDRNVGPDPLDLFLVDLDGDARAELNVLHDYGLLWIYSAQATASVSFEAARVLDLPFSTTVVAPAQLDGDGIIDLVGARTGSEPFSFLNNHSSPQLYEFERIDATIADVESRRLAAFGTPTAVKFVELDGVPPLEIIVTSSGPFGNVANAGVRVLFGQ